MKFEFNWPSGFKYRWDSNISDIGRKVNLDLWKLFIAIVSSGLTYQVRKMTVALTVFKNQLFKKIPI